MDEKIEFLKELQDRYPILKIEATWKDGRCGLEDMSFPRWKLSVSISKETYEKWFDDEIRYSRCFGDTRFHNHEKHIASAVAWIESILE